MDVLHICAGEFGLSWEDGPVRVVEKSWVALSCGESLLLTARSGGRTGKGKVGAGDCASVAEEFRACFVQ